MNSSGYHTRSIVFDAESDGTFIDFNTLFKAFPFLMKRVLASVGFNAARELYKNHLSGQDITYRTNRFSSSRAPLSRDGRRMVMYAVKPNAEYVAVSSFPLNLFERGRTLRSGMRETGRFILRRFQRSFNPMPVAERALAEIVQTSYENAEYYVRGSFGRGESPFGDNARVRAGGRGSKNPEGSWRRSWSR